MFRVEESCTYNLVKSQSHSRHLKSVRSRLSNFSCMVELGGTKAYEQTSEKEKSVIDNHIFHNATRFAVSVNEDQERLPTFYWLPKLHKKTVIRLDLLLILAHVQLPNYQNC